MKKFDKNAVRRKVNQSFFKNELPTIDKVLIVINDDPLLLPSFKRTTFDKLRKMILFCGEETTEKKLNGK